ncbi:MAG: hypothetical protein J6Z17_01095 [Treponema sp.]|nr:hypothetical protein [Treponema sp.]
MENLIFKGTFMLDNEDFDDFAVMSDYPYDDDLSDDFEDEEFDDDFDDDEDESYESAFGDDMDDDYDEPFDDQEIEDGYDNRRGFDDGFYNEEEEIEEDSDPADLEF